MGNQNTQTQAAFTKSGTTTTITQLPEMNNDQVIISAGEIDVPYAK